MKKDLSTMSRAELLDLQGQVHAALKDAEVRDRMEARAAAEKAVAEFGFELSEVLPGLENGRRKAAEKTASPPKYRNPENHSQTWTGRGRKPGWFNDALAGGASPEDLEV